MTDAADVSVRGGELASASLVELAVSRLSREILSGNSDPGDRLIEEQLTRRFGISRQLSIVYESVLLKIQLYMAINLRRESEHGQPQGGVQRHERLIDALTTGDESVVLAALNAHGARAYLT